MPLSPATPTANFFPDFTEFADVVNWWLSHQDFGSRWRLQELPESDVRLNVSFSDGPILGRCYDIFHNQVRLGRLEIRPGYEYSAGNPQSDNRNRAGTWCGFLPSIPSPGS